MSGYMKIGWAEADITPERHALLSGMFHARLSEGYGSIPANNPAGTEAGKQLVDKTVQGLRELWDKDDDKRKGAASC